MKKLSLLLSFLLLVLSGYAQQAKYVFYFIGDGMGVNQVQGTELYRGELEGKIGITPIWFTQFPMQLLPLLFRQLTELLTLPQPVQLLQQETRLKTVR